MRLEARFDGGLDLFDAADEFLDRGAGGGIEERDARWWRDYLVGFTEQPTLKDAGKEYAALMVVE